MKLRAKIILLSVFPVILLGMITMNFSTFQLKKGIYQEAYDGMHATTLAVRNIFETGNTDGLNDIAERLNKSINVFQY